MAKGKKGFFDYFKIPDDDEEYDDDDIIFDEDDDDDYEDPVPVRKAPKPAPKTVAKPTYDRAPKETKKYTGFGNSQPAERASDKLVSFDGGADRYAEKRPRSPKSSEVFVIKPQEFDDAQTVADFLKRGKAIVINMEGLQLESAQRIIDFIGGACYGMGGELKAISASIFIAVPNNIEVSGDLREEILNSSSVSPFLG
ncbi:cell division inhibitor SepF [Lachnospiraceae bacterium NE2001]|jgi:cell division inhibitor SepF|nr:cell division inhibitor SepF [Lachnospiraceae bacterium NE2001]